MSKEDIIELDTTLELKEPHAAEAQSASLSLGQDDAVFATLKAPQSSSIMAQMDMPTEASEAPYICAMAHGELAPHDSLPDAYPEAYPEAYPDGYPEAYPDAFPDVSSSTGNDDILELDSTTVIHPQYKVTTELFVDPAENVQKQAQHGVKTAEKVESLHIETFHADNVHVGEVHIKNLHDSPSSKGITSTSTLASASTSTPISAPVPTSAEARPDVQDSEQETATDKPNDPTVQQDDAITRILRDMNTLQTAMASMQLRLAAQDACIASLESRLMVAEAQNRELETLYSKHEGLCVQHDTAHLEHTIASTAARVVREEIQALLALAEQQ